MNRGISDLREVEARKMVVFGESHAVGASASGPEMGWAGVLKDLIDTFQDEPVELINHSIGADIFSAASPLYEEYEGKRPIGMERYRKHVIEEQPDIVLFSFGYNDMRSGTPLDRFRKDFEKFLKDVESETDALIVIMNTYAVPPDGYLNETGGSLSGKAWDKGTREIHTLYNLMFNDVAADHGLIFADIHSTQVRAPWTFCGPDGKDDIHANDLGHRLIGNRLFEILATRCSFLSVKPQKTRKKQGKSPWRYGEDSAEAKLIAEFYPDSPELTKFKKPTKRSLK
jgi:lysophospholipase L1-like esterase